MSVTQTEVRDFVMKLVRDGKPFEIRTVADAFGTESRVISSILTRLKQRGELNYRFSADGSHGDRQIILNDGTTTPWPTVDPLNRLKASLAHRADIQRRREARETEREEHRRHWLDQERAPRMRPVLDHMDRETSRALQGIGA